jgi:FMN phosphatase YigB (HAD superfamily)
LTQEEQLGTPGDWPLGTRVRTVFFDAGNTLLYLDLAWIARRLKNDGWEITEEGLFYGQCVAAYEATRMALLKKYPTDSDRLLPYFRRVLELAGIPRDFTGDCAGILAEEHRTSNLWHLAPEFVRDTLGQLERRGYMLGVVSNSDGRLKSLLDAADLTGFFTCIIDSAAVGAEKPCARIFQCALDAAETDPEKCVYVGDIYAIDMAGARAAGITGILIDPLSLHGEFDCLRIRKLPLLLNLLPPIECPPVMPPD